MKLKPQITLCIAVFGLTTLGVTAEEKNHDGHDHAKVEAHADHMMEGYQAVHTALFKDNLKDAQKAAAGMVKHDKKSSLAPAATKLSHSKSLAEARKSFEKMSEAAVKMAKGKKEFAVVKCPMAFDNKGASWVQAAGSKVQNPYFGSKMPGCGSFVK
jgi:Cu(I)/Ag(I) efflux system membrane fusion protein